MLAPIALYPDALLMQVLMAATYPLDVVKAANWSKANPNKKGDAAVQGVANETWDVSVKSLVAFPQVLSLMGDKIDWTQKVGDAFLGQQKDVLDSVQRLRAQAQAAGNLNSNQQQTVTTQGETIVIQPANPQVIYVPAYNPTVVYGAWAYPAYPPVYYPPPPAYYPGGALVSGFAWGVGLAAAGAIFSDCDWDRGDVDVNVNKAVNIDRNFNAANIDRTNINRGDTSRTSWQHNPQQRGGVAYRDATAQQRYGKSVPGAEARQQYRGRDQGTQVGAAQRQAAVSDRAASLDQQDRARTTEGARDFDRPAKNDFGRQSTQRQAGAFEGIGNGPQVNREAARGHSSQAMASRGGSSGGGGARTGGGGGGRGGGRR